MFSINLTIHNKEYLLPEVLSSIKNNTIGNYELIFVIDGCTDNSMQMVEFFCYQTPNIKTLIQETPDVFETKSNNVAAKWSSGDQIIIIQDDMIITEHGWDKRLLSPFKAFNDVFAVTGRCAHNWMANPESKDLHSKTTHNGWSDILFHCDHADKSNTDRNTFAVRDSVNRGPLAINRADMEKLNYFDEIYAPLDSDEHDLMYRSKSIGKVCGFYDIGWYSKPEWGGTRNEDGSTKTFMYQANQKNARILHERHKDLMTKRTIDNRKI